MSAQRLVDLAQRLDELSEELPELSGISEELGALADKWPDPNARPPESQKSRVMSEIERLVEREVHERLRYDARYRGYGYREQDRLDAMAYSRMATLNTPNHAYISLKDVLIP